MLNQIFSLKRSLIIFDCESTGTNVQTDRIVEIAFQLWNADGLSKEWSSLVNPQIPIPAAATAVHHITDDDVKNKPVFGQLATSIARGFKDCDYGGKRVRFDLQLLASEMAREKVEWGYLGARVIDAERLEQIAVPRSLSHLHEKYTGAKHDGAHGALSDVRASTTVIMHQLQAHQTLPRDLDILHNLQWPNLIDPDGKFRFVDGVACFAQWGKYQGQPMRNADKGYWEFIIAKDFSADVKALAREALAGRFPVAK